MTEYWQSQARKFCDFCKCWIADQKVSIEFHENGKRHQQAVKDRLRDIGQKGARDQKKSAKEEQWLKQIEQQAMKDYRAKDLQENSDLTAKIFNEKRYERDNERLAEDSMEKSKRKYDIANESNICREETAPSQTGCMNDESPGPGPPLWGIPSKTTVTGSGLSSTKSPFEQRVSAKTHGTKYHNPPPETNWREAITEDGNVYYWHTISHASVWEPPGEGFISIKEQEKVAEKLHRLEDTQTKRTKANEKDDRKRVSSKTSNTSTIQGPLTKPDPYGTWKPVSENDVNQGGNTSSFKVVDYQTPEVKQDHAPNLVLHNDRTKKFEIGSKKTPSLGLDDQCEFQVDYSAGIKPTAPSKLSISSVKTVSSGNPSEAVKPSIVFRKRKVNPDHRKVARRREDDD